jgi:2-aminoadipate transaminase
MAASALNPASLFASRIGVIPASFIREILKTTVRPEVISFAGGLPNPKFFPVDAINTATDKVLRADGRAALQYSTTEGYLPLREYIAARYKRVQGLTISPDEILIVSGSQQALDLLGKVFVNKGDDVAIEKPGYLGAIQSLTAYEPTFHGVTLTDEGVDTDELASVYAAHKPKMFCAIPNFQNPSGLSYTAETRERVADVAERYNTVVVEDDPYGDLRFSGDRKPSLRHYLGERAILMGSFSKIVAPGLRLGWIVASKPIMEKLVIVKQASDLHTNTFAQRVMHQYLLDNDLDTHITSICRSYGEQCDAMLSALGEYFPAEIRYTKPEGGMFVWATLPDGCSSMELFDLALAQNVAFVPGVPFYVDGSGANTLRLNYSSAGADTIHEGVRRMGAVLEEMLGVPA